MAKPRVELQSVLEDVLGSREVYFQPPNNRKLSYPCIIYHLSDIDIDHADDIDYKKYKRYDLTLITRNPDDPLIDAVESLKYCSLDRAYAADNLNHYSYTIYF